MDFKTRYRRECLQFGTAPLHAVEHQLSENILDFKYFRIPPTEWPPLLNALSNDTSLKTIRIKIEYNDHSIANKSHVKKLEHVRELCKALALCLSKNHNLRELCLTGIPIKANDAEFISEGILENASLSHLSFAQCLLSDVGASVICRAVQTRPKIEWLDLSSCNLTAKSGQTIAELIIHQTSCRKSAAWKATLREQAPDFDLMGGLRRITLNDNDLGDLGVDLIAGALNDDMWFKAIDLQQCHVGNEGASTFLQTLNRNSSIVLLDLRHNPNIRPDILEQIQRLCETNAAKQSIRVKWEPLELQQPLPVSKSLATVKTKSKAKAVQTPVRHSHPKKTSPTVNQGVPWRVAARLQKPSARESPPTKEDSSPEPTTNKTTNVQPNRELEEELKEERRKRMEAEHQVIQMYEELQKSWDSSNKLRNKLRQIKLEKKRSDSPIHSNGVYLDKATVASFQNCLIQMQGILADLRAVTTKPESRSTQQNGMEQLMKTLQATADELKAKVNDISTAFRPNSAVDQPAKKNSASVDQSAKKNPAAVDQPAKKNPAAVDQQRAESKATTAAETSESDDKISSLKNLQDELQSLLHNVDKETSRKENLEISAKILDNTAETVQSVTHGRSSKKSRSVNEDYSFDFSNSTIASNATSIRSVKTSQSSAVKPQRASQLSPAVVSKTSTPKDLSSKRSEKNSVKESRNSGPKKFAKIPASNESTSSSTLNLSSIADLIGDLNTSQIGSSTLTPP